MDKPRRRAAGRPAGPPNVVSDPPPTALSTTDRPASDPPMTGLVQEDQSGNVPTGQADRTGQQPRRRQRHARQPNGDEPSATSSASEPPRTKPEPIRAQHQRPSSGQSFVRDDRRRGESPIERSLRALVSTRTTQLTPTVAMRAREVAAPTIADLQAAEQDLVIVRRFYVPPAPLATTGKAPEQRRTEGRPTESRARGAEVKRAARRSPPG